MIKSAGSGSIKNKYGFTALTSVKKMPFLDGTSLWTEDPDCLLAIIKDIFVDKGILLEIFLFSLVTTLEAGGTFLKIKVLKTLSLKLYINSGIPVLSELVSTNTALKVNCSAL